LAWRIAANIAKLPGLFCDGVVTQGGISAP
jgi:hypothetical protein